MTVMCRKFQLLVAAAGWIASAGAGACSGDESPAEATEVVDGADTGGGDVSPGAPDTAPEPDTVDRTAFPLDQPGPFAVGYREIEVTYEPAGGTGERTIRLAVWYPALPEGEAVSYLDTIERPEVFRDAPPALPGPLPVLLFSHGHLSFAEQSFFLTERFATHGFLVLAPDHAGNTFVDALEERTTEVYLHRPQDLTAALDHLEALPESDPLHGLAGGEVVVAGHSFGGWTTFVLAGATFPIEALSADCAAGATYGDFCSTLTPSFEEVFAGGLGDPRVDLAIPMASGNSSLLGPSGVGAIEVPVLMMTAALDQGPTEEKESGPYWAALDGAADVRVDLQTGGHHSFDVACEHFPILGDDGCGEENLDPAEAHRIVMTYALAFARAHLFEDPAAAAVIAGSVLVSEDVVLSTKSSP